MSLGYDVHEDDRSFEQEGITGTVTRYATSSLEFPCYIVSAPFEKYKIQVLRTMIENHSSSADSEPINLYFREEGSTVGLGKIMPTQVKAFLKLFESNKIEGYLDKDSKLEGDYLYTLSVL